jgi:hypothetical protein
MKHQLLLRVLDYEFLLLSHDHDLVRLLINLQREQVHTSSTTIPPIGAAF